MMRLGVGGWGLGVGGWGLGVGGWGLGVGGWGFYLQCSRAKAIAGAGETIANSHWHPAPPGQTVSPNQGGHVTCQHELDLWREG